MEYIRTIQYYIHSYSVSWVNDITYMPLSDLLVVCGMDRYIVFYDFNLMVVNELLPISSIKGLGIQYYNTYTVTTTTGGTSCIKIIPISTSSHGSGSNDSTDSNNNTNTAATSSSSSNNNNNNNTLLTSTPHVWIYVLSMV